MEKHIDGLYDWATNFNWLEKRQLQFYFSHFKLANKDGTLQACKDHH